MRLPSWLAVSVVLVAPAVGAAQSARSGAARAAGGLPRLVEAPGAPASGPARPPAAAPGWGWPVGGPCGGAGCWPPGVEPFGGSAGGLRPAPRVRPRVIVVGIPLAALGPVSPAGAPAGSGTPLTLAARRVPPTKVVGVVPTAPGAADAVAAHTVAAEPLAGGLLRLRWIGKCAIGCEVTLLVADSARGVIAAQTVHAVPYTAVFDAGARVAFVGSTIVQADGVSTTTLVPRATAAARRDEARRDEARRDEARRRRAPGRERRRR